MISFDADAITDYDDDEYAQALRDYRREEEISRFI